MARDDTSGVVAAAGGGGSGKLGVSFGSAGIGAPSLFGRAVSRERRAPPAFPSASPGLPMTPGADAVAAVRRGRVVAAAGGGDSRDGLSLGSAGCSEGAAAAEPVLPQLRRPRPRSRDDASADDSSDIGIERGGGRGGNGGLPVPGMLVAAAASNGSGRERGAAGAASAAEVGEMLSINSSLSALAGCVVALSEPGRSHVPYRDSVLTRLLQVSERWLGE